MAKATVKSALPLSRRSAWAWERLNLSRALLAAYLGLVVYGSLYPFIGWDWGRGGLQVLLSSFSLKHLPRADVILNLVIYIPVGLLMFRSWAARTGSLTRVAAATLCGIFLSVTMEYLQSYLPTRVSSLVDLTLNSLGTLLGAVLAHTMAAHGATGLRLQRIRNQIFLPGRMINLGLMVLGLWTLSQLSPLVPSLDRDVVVYGVRPLHATFRYTEFQRIQVVTYALSIAAAGVIASHVVRPERPFLALFAAWVGAILACKLALVNWELAPEMVLGAGTGLLLFALLSSAQREVRLWTAGAMVVLGFSMAQLHSTPYPYAARFAMNWIPFRNHLEGRTGFEDIIANLWPFAALAYLTLLTKPRRYPMVAAAGGLLVLVCSLAIEWLQTHLPGHHPDLTETGLAVLGWGLPWLYAFRSKGW